jgi:mRNA interferase YafQ
MRKIERSSVFKRDYKRVKSTPKYHKSIEMLLSDVISILMSNKVLPEKYHDHALSGHFAGYRECHLKPDLLLIYQKPTSETLKLARLGSHSELFR